MPPNDFIYSANKVAGGQHVPVAITATSTSAVFYTALRPMQFMGATLRLEDASGSGGAVTATIYKVPNGTVISSGTALLSSTFNLKGTEATNQVGAIITDGEDVKLQKGDSLALVLSGSLDGATGNITVLLNYLGFHTN